MVTHGPRDTQEIEDALRQLARGAQHELPLEEPPAATAEPTPVPAVEKTEQVKPPQPQQAEQPPQSPAQPQETLDDASVVLKRHIDGLRQAEQLQRQQQE